MEGQIQSRGDSLAENERSMLPRISQHFLVGVGSGVDCMSLQGSEDGEGHIFLRCLTFLPILVSFPIYLQASHFPCPVELSYCVVCQIFRGCSSGWGSDLKWPSHMRSPPSLPRLCYVCQCGFCYSLVLRVGNLLPTGKVFIFGTFVSCKINIYI